MLYVRRLTLRDSLEAQLTTVQSEQSRQSSKFTGVATGPKKLGIAP